MALDTCTPLTTDEILALPAVIDAKTLATALGVSESHIYRETAAGRPPTPVLRIGRLIRFRRADVLQLLGIEAHQ